MTKPKFHWPKEAHETMIRMLASGSNYKQVGEALNLTPPMIARRVRQTEEATGQKVERPGVHVGGLAPRPSVRADFVVRWPNGSISHDGGDAAVTVPRMEALAQVDGFTVERVR